jgi:arylsulfatase A-like enzyme
VKRLDQSILVVLIFTLLTPVVCGSNKVKHLPNVVFILADDLGYGDVGTFNPDSKIPTPNIDQLARLGIRLTDAHAPASVCVPSRYGLLTGRYMFRNHRVFQQEALIEPGRLTLAPLFKAAGYATAMIGKWHLSFEGGGLDPGGGTISGQAFDYTKRLRGGPTDHGFDSFFGMHASLDVSPYFFIENDRVVEAPTATIEEHHSPDVRFIQGEFWRGGAIAADFKHEDVLLRFSDRAVKYLESRTGSQQPFFLYLALTAPHAPWLPVAPFRDKSRAGMYGDFVAQVDDVVGRVVDALERAGKTSDTLVFFTSDNGPTWYESDVQKFNHRAAGVFRGMKADVWEGGHRMPFVARWPNKIAAGTSSSQLVSFTDMLATFASLTGQKLPAGAGEDSFDILPVLLGKCSKPIREAMVHEATWPTGMLAIREGNWKLIPWLGDKSVFEGFDDKGGFTPPAPEAPQPGGPAGQLYNLADDPGERKNVYAEHPQIVQRLTELLERYRRESQSRGEF